MSDKVRRYWCTDNSAMCGEEPELSGCINYVLYDDYASLESKLKALIDATQDLMAEVGDMPGKPRECIASWAKVEKAIAETEEGL